MSKKSDDPSGPRPKPLRFHPHIMQPKLRQDCAKTSPNVVQKCPPFFRRHIRHFT